MTASTDPSLATNARRTMDRIREAIRGPALVLLRKIASTEPRADVQQVVKIRNERGQTAPAGPTPQARMLTIGTGGFQMSFGMEDDDGALAVPLESDHENFYSTAKISDPATLRTHTHSLAALLPFRWLSKIKAMQAEMWLGHAGKGVHFRINREQLLLELEWPSGQGRLDLGFGAVLGAGRVTDPVVGTMGFTAWAAGVDAALVVAMSENLVPYPPDGKIGTIAEGSAEVFIR